MRAVLSFIQRLLGLVVLILALIPVLGPPIYREIAGVTTTGTIAAKQEVIFVRDEIWTRHFIADVRYRPVAAEQSDDEAPLLDIAVDEPTYDALRVGQQAGIRYIAHPWVRYVRGLGVARFEAQSPLDSVLARLGPTFGALLAGILAWLLLLAAWNKTRNGWLAGLLLLGMIAAGLWFGSAWRGPTPPGTTAPAMATVRAVKRIDRVWGGRRTPAEDAVQPFEIVQLAYTPRQVGDEVIGVDLVDAGSVKGIEQGATLPIHYKVGTPRWAEIDGASRTYYWKNLRTFGIIALFFVLLFLGTSLFGRKRRAPALP